MVFVGAPPISLPCSVCGKIIKRYACHLKRVKTPVCSYHCNGILRGKELVRHSHKGRAAWTEESRRSYLKKMTGPNNPAWKGGVTFFKTHGNYVGVRYIRAPEWAKTMARKDGYVMEHRLVMARLMGRLLSRTEVVNHVDHNPANNNPSNLELYPNNRLHKLAEFHRAEGVASRLYPKV